jgi:hypothetical protein
MMGGSTVYEITRRLDGTYMAEVMSQSGWERHPEPTFRAAVAAVIRGAKAINHEMIDSSQISYFVVGADGNCRCLGSCREVIDRARARAARRAADAVGPAGGDGADVPGGAKAPAGRERSWLGLAVEKLGRWLDEPKGGEGT